MTARYRQSAPAIGLAIERATESVPDDGGYYVLLRGEIVFVSHSQREALAEYRRLRDSLSPAAQATMNRDAVASALRKAAAEQEVTAFLAQSAREKRARATRKGGPGGSGGVSG